MINQKSLAQLSKHRNILLQGNDFAYVLPSSELRAAISNFTLTFPNRTMISDAYTILPHGSVTLVFFMYQEELHSLLFGPATRTIKVGELANKCAFICIIEFQPAGFSLFTSMNQKDLTDLILPFSLVDHALDFKCKEILSKCQTGRQAIEKLEHTLLHAMRSRYPKQLSEAIHTIIQTKGCITSDELADTVSYSSRQLNRLFNQYIGMSRKAFARLVRINQAFPLLNDQTMTLHTICDQLNYYDASHFVKDFKHVCNITPEEYKTNMSDFYNEIAKFTIYNID